MPRIRPAFARSRDFDAHDGCIARVCGARDPLKYPNGPVHWQCSSSCQFGDLFLVLLAIEDVN